jgi:hypothetical protein
VDDPGHGLAVSIAVIGHGAPDVPRVNDDLRGSAPLLAFAARQAWSANPADVG